MRRDRSLLLALLPLLAPPGIALAQCDGPAPAGPSVPTGIPGPSPITPGGFPVLPGCPIPIGPVTGSTGASAATDSWRFWWEVNRERFLDLRQNLSTLLLSAPAPLTPRTLGLADAEESLQRRATPALLAALKESSNGDLEAICLVALARARSDAAAIQPVLESFVADRDQRVAEAAVLALGILGAPSCIAPLLAIHGATDAGAALCKSPEVPWRLRPVAGYALGVLGSGTRNPHHHARIRAGLVAWLEGEGMRPTPRKDLPLATVVALGLLPDPTGDSALALQRWESKAGPNDVRVLGQVPVAIARLLQHAPPPERQRYASILMERLRDSKDVDRRVVPGYATALGKLARLGESHAPDVIAALEALVADVGRNAEAAGFALLALGEIAADEPAGGAIEKRLLERATFGKSRSMLRAWAAIALGVSQFERSRRGAVDSDVVPAASLAKGRRAVAPPADAVADALLEHLASLRDPEHAAAVALALGLRRHGAAAPEIRRWLGKTRDESLRGYFPLALGLLPAAEARKDLAEVIDASLRQPWVLSQTAVGLALTGDASVTGKLLAHVADRNSGRSSSQAAVAAALGLVGDARAIDPLLALLTAPATAGRAAAADALGRLADGDELPWFARLSADFNYVGAEAAQLGFVAGS